MTTALKLLAGAIVAGSCFALAVPASADTYPDPGFPVVACPAAGQKVVVNSDAQLDPTCVYSGGFEITASDTTLDCRGASVTGPTSGVGIRVQTPVDQDMSGVTVRNCVISGFLNGIRVTRIGFRALEAGHEYDNGLTDVTLAGNEISGTRGVGIFVDGYVTDTTITDSTISETGGSGIYLEAGSADNVVTGNQILDNGFRENGPGGQVETFDGQQFRFWGIGREGISIDGSRNNLVSGNTFEGNSAGGIFVYTNCGEYVNSKPGNYFERRYGATGNQMTGNHFTGGVNGIWIAARMGESVLPMECSDVPYYEEGITQITLDRASDNTVSDNHFEDVTYGVRVEDDDTEVSDNSFSGSEGEFAVMIGTPYRTSVLDRPVSGTQLIDNQATITGNGSPYRWVEGEDETTVTGNTANGVDAGICESESLPRGPFVMTIAIAYEPVGSPVTPPPEDLGIPVVGPQPPCPQPPEPPLPPPTTPDPPTIEPSNRFELVGLKLNRRTGGAVITVKVPGEGRLLLKGTRTVRQQKKNVKADGRIRLTIRAKGKAARKLKRTGRSRVRASITFRPTGGSPRTRSRSINLVKKSGGGPAARTR